MVHLLMEKTVYMFCGLRYILGLSSPNNQDYLTSKACERTRVHVCACKGIYPNMGLRVNGLPYLGTSGPWSDPVGAHDGCGDVPQSCNILHLVASMIGS